MPASIETAKPLFHRLSVWRERMPLPTDQPILHDMLGGSQSTCQATVYNAYLTLVVCIWRALLRTTVRSSEPPQIIHVDDPFEGGHCFPGDNHWNFSGLPEMDFRPTDDRSESSTMVQELYEAALHCASTVVDFVSKLTAPVFSEFWYTCM